MNERIIQQYYATFYCCYLNANFDLMTSIELKCKVSISRFLCLFIFITTMKLFHHCIMVIKTQLHASCREPAHSVLLFMQKHCELTVE